MPIPQNNRLSLKKNPDLFKDKPYKSNIYFKIVFSKSDDGGCRFTVLLSKQVSILAVKRHRIKRRILNCLYSQKNNIKTGSYLIIPRKESVDLNPQDLQDQLLFLIKQL